MNDSKRKVRLGIDLGAKSLGWCLVDIDEDIGDGEIKAIGARIFSDGRDPKKGTSLAVDRRIARGMRRRRDRFLRRRSVLISTLQGAGLFPALESREAKELERLDPYELRTRALDEKLEPHHIGRALFHLNQRRGFKSNRKTDRKDDDSTKISTGTANLDTAMEASGARTLGEYLHCHAPTKRVRMRDTSADEKNTKDVYDFYPDRRHYEHEFAAIWEAQAKHYPTLLTDKAREAIHRVIFYQRKLKPVEVGRCSFAGVDGIPDKAKRIAKAHPLFQLYRLYQEVNHLKIIEWGQQVRDLTLDERDVLIEHLRGQQSATFAGLAKVLGLPRHVSFHNIENRSEKLYGDEVSAALGDASCFGAAWRDIPLTKKVRLIKRLGDAGSEEEIAKLRQWLEETYSLPSANIDAILAEQLPNGYGHLGRKATCRILEKLKAEVITYDKAVVKAGLSKDTGEVFEYLPPYEEILGERVTNPTVHIGLNQLRRVVNAIIKKHGRPEHVVIELARELKLNEKQKDKAKKTISKNTKDKDKRRAKLAELGLDPENAANHKKLRLWEEQDKSSKKRKRYCPYCGEEITIEQLFTSAIEIDHILPRNTSLDDSLSNKVVAHIHCNRQKTDRTPWDAWRGDESRWKKIAPRIKQLPKTKRWRFEADAMEQFEKQGDFLARYLKDTQYLSRAAAQYVQALYGEEKDKGKRRVFASNGQVTALLRRKWGLNAILWEIDHSKGEQRDLSREEKRELWENKNRNDHRHHAIDAFVLAVTTNSRIQQIATAAGRTGSADDKVRYEEMEQERGWNAPPAWDGFRDDLRDALRDTIVSHKPDHGLKGQRLIEARKTQQKTSGQLHEATAYGLTTNAVGTPMVRDHIELTKIKPKHIKDEDCIIDGELRDALLNLYEAKKDLGFIGKELEEEYKKALSTFAETGIPQGKNKGRFKGIRRVRIRKPLNVIAIKDKQGKAYKAYKGGSNARYDIWQLPPDSKGQRKWVADVISTYDIHQRDFNEANRRPHPAAKKIMSLRQNDLIAIEEEGETRIMRVQKFGQDGRISLAEHHEANADGRNRDAKDPFKLLSPFPEGLRKKGARRIRVDELGRVWDPGPPS